MKPTEITNPTPPFPLPAWAEYRERSDGFWMLAISDRFGNGTGSGGREPPTAERWAAILAAGEEFLRLTGSWDEPHTEGNG